MSSFLFTLLGTIFTLLLRGFFSGLETAFITANKLSIELKKKQGKSSGIILSKFMEQPERFTGMCLVGINLFLVMYVLFFGTLLQPVWNNFKVGPALALGGNILAATLLTLVLGEFIPKAIFRAKNDSLLSFFAPLSKFFYKLFYPVAAITISMSDWILKYVFNVRVRDKNEAFGRDLEHFFQQNKEQDEENQELNTELFENALSLPMIKIRQCLVPRTEVEGFDIKTPLRLSKAAYDRYQAEQNGHF